MALAIAGILALIVLGLVLFPFLRSRLVPPTSRVLRDLEALIARREAVYAAMETLRLEMEIGSIEEGEYQRRLREYRVQAADALREQERLTQGLATLEEAVMEARARLQAHDAPQCGHCGSPLDPAADRCSACGALQGDNAPQDDPR